MIAMYDFFFPLPAPHFHCSQPEPKLVTDIYLAE